MFGHDHKKYVSEKERRDRLHDALWFYGSLVVLFLIGAVFMMWSDREHNGGFIGCLLMAGFFLIPFILNLRELTKLR